MNIILQTQKMYEIHILKEKLLFERISDLKKFCLELYFESDFYGCGV